MISILMKELRAYFSSLIAYIVIIIFLAATGILTWIGIPSLADSVFDTGYSSLDSLFSVGIWVLLLLIPAITMGSFAEEKRTGTIELLLTRPITNFQLIGGKFLAIMLLVSFAILPTLVYYFTIYLLGSPVGNIDSAGTFGSYIGLVGLAGVFCSIGMFASSITNSQIVSFILALTLCFFISVGLGWVSDFFMWSPAGPILKLLGADEHYRVMSKGLLDSRDLLYFVSVVAIMLLATKLSLDSRKW